MINIAVAITIGIFGGRTPRLAATGDGSPILARFGKISHSPEIVREFAEGRDGHADVETVVGFGFEDDTDEPLAIVVNVAPHLNGIFPLRRDHYLCHGYPISRHGLRPATIAEAGAAASRARRGPAHG